MRQLILILIIILSTVPAISEETRTKNFIASFEKKGIYQYKYIDICEFSDCGHSLNPGLEGRINYLNIKLRTEYQGWKVIKFNVNECFVILEKKSDQRLK